MISITIVFFEKTRIRYKWEGSCNSARSAFSSASRVAWSTCFKPAAKVAQLHLFETDMPNAESVFEKDKMANPSRNSRKIKAESAMEPWIPISICHELWSILLQSEDSYIVFFPNLTSSRSINCLQNAPKSALRPYHYKHQNSNFSIKCKPFELIVSGDSSFSWKKLRSLGFF